jgi:adenine-specific DNA-methyltransferase
LQAQNIRNIGHQIIYFLAQVEDFQKRLFEKKKFVIRTDYCITIDRVPEALWDEVLQNKDQLAEWRQLYGVDPQPTKEFLREQPYLVVDTRHFSEDFKWRLLAHFDDLDEALDGLLVKSENFQALNTILAKFRNKVQIIYIDPPFNKKQDADYHYSVKYKDATWITQLANRVQLGREMLNEKGAIFVRCDYNGNMYVRLMMDEIFGKENFRNEIFVKRGYVPKGAVKQYQNGVDSIFFYAKNLLYLSFRGAKRRIKESDRQWIPLDMPGQRKTYEKQVRCFFGKLLLPPKGQHWGLSQEKINEYEKLGWIRINPNRTYIDTQGNTVVGMPEYLKEPELLLDNNWTDIKSYETHNTGFPTENAEMLLKRVIEGINYEAGAIVMDFFLGSGTTVAVAHKLGRKWIGVEMGEHFHTIVLPRMKRVLFYDKSGISKEKDVQERYNPKKAGGFFKYLYLEQYEDTLNNLDLTTWWEEEQLALEQFGDEYLLHYILESDTQSKPSLLNIKQLHDPFNYKIRVCKDNEIRERVVDLVETFNYLLGIRVKKMRQFQDNGRIYRAVLGEKNDKSIVIVWRPSNDLNSHPSALQRDHEFIKHTILPILLGNGKNPNLLLVNGNCYGSDVKSSENK